MLEWLKNKEIDDKKKQEEKKEEDSFELKPKDVKEKLDKIDALATDMASFKSKVGVLDRINSFMDAEDAKSRKQQKEQQQEQQQQTSEELEQEFITDPAAATKKLLQQTMSPLIVAQVNTAARMTMKELFDSHPEEFEFGTDPDIRKHVESQMATLPLDKRADLESIRNCYYVATGRFQAQIKEGKIKSRLSAASGSGTGTGSPKGEADKTVVLSDREKQAAKVFGLSEEDYAKSKKELNYV